MKIVQLNEEKEAEEYLRSAEVLSGEEKKTFLSIAKGKQEHASLVGDFVRSLEEDCRGCDAHPFPLK